MKITFEGTPHEASYDLYYDGILDFYIRELDIYLRVYDFCEDYDIWLAVKGEGNLSKLPYIELEEYQPFSFYKEYKDYNFIKA